MVFLRQLQGTFRPPKFVRCAKLTKQTTLCGRGNSICSQHQPANECHHGTATNRGPHSSWHKELLLHQVVPKLTTRKWMVFQRFPVSNLWKRHSALFPIKGSQSKSQSNNASWSETIQPMNQAILMLWIPTHLKTATKPLVPLIL
jgi:hypothetical protein